MKRFAIILALMVAPAVLSAQSRQELLSDIMYLRRQVDSLRAALNEYKLKEAQDGTPQKKTSIIDFWDDDSDLALIETDTRSDGLVSTWDLLVEEAENEYGKQEEYSAQFADQRPFDALDQKMLLERLASLPYELSIGYNDIVRNYVLIYAEKKKKYMPNVLAKYEYYAPLFRETFRKYGIPEDLTVLAIIESAMNPTATSVVGAKGYWQFMEHSAKHFGLTVNYQVDERMDLYKAVDASARYLKKAYERYGSWPLAISSYNCGPGNVNRAIKLAGTNNYWEIYKYLPKETRGYMPAFIGALYTVYYYKSHGMEVKPLQNEDCDCITLKSPVDFVTVQKACGCPVSELRRLNPQYIRNVVYVPKGGTATLRIPKKYSGKFGK